VRATNLAPTQWLHERERYTTMEKLLAQYVRSGDIPV
jgi:probable phosphoglycerate mutase